MLRRDLMHPVLICSCVAGGRVSTSPHDFCITLSLWKKFATVAGQMTPTPRPSKPRNSELSSQVLPSEVEAKLLKLNCRVGNWRWGRGVSSSKRAQCRAQEEREPVERDENPREAGSGLRVSSFGADPSSVVTCWKTVWSLSNACSQENKPIKTVLSVQTAPMEASRCSQALGRQGSGYTGFKMKVPTKHESHSTRSTLSQTGEGSTCG